MLQLLLLAGVAALTALGCAENIESPGPSSPDKPPPPPDYPDQFGDDEKAKWVRLQLIKKGIHGPELDRGCPTYKYFQDGRFERFFEGREDKKISKCEVYEFPLDQYEKYPEIAEAIAEKPIPWSLDDRNHATNFDQGIREKVQNAIHQLDHLLRKGGIQPGSEEYQEGMALGLFYFSAVPTPAQLQERKEEIARLQAKPDKSQKEETELKNNIWRLQYHQANIREIDEEMARIHLAEFVKFHQEQGGFYLTNPDGDPTQEYDALDALQKHSGECSERSKILFAVFKMAGLSPTFVDIDLLKSEDPYAKRAIIEDPFTGHICIQVKIGNRFFLLDPSFIKLDPHHRVYFPLTLREYLAVDDYDRALTTTGMKQKKKMEFIQKALQLDPNSFSAWAARASLKNQSGDWEGAIEDYTRAIEINPSDALNYFSRGAAWDEMGNKEKAEADYNQAIAKFSDFGLAYANRGIVLLKKNEQTKARGDFIHALKISPQNSFQTISFGITDQFNLELEKPEMEQVANTISEEANLGWAYAKAIMAVSVLLWEIGQHQMARDKVKEGVIKSALGGKEKLEKDKKRFSQVTVKFLMSLFHELPPSMRKDPEILTYKKSLGLGGQP